MEDKLRKISEVKNNPNNPRFIRDEKYEKLLKSIKQSPRFMKLRPIIVDENDVVLGGNMRLKACFELGMKKTYIDTFTREDAEENNKVRTKEGLEPQTYEKQCDEFIIKDNASFGEWENDTLYNEWDVEELKEWGVDIWQPEDVDLNDFFEEDNTSEQGEEKNKIILEYTDDEFELVKNELTKYGETYEQAVWKLLKLE